MKTMADMLHQIGIDALPRAVLAALTTEAGLRAWWTADSVARPELGSVAEFGFGNRATVFRMRVAELSDTRVMWECLGDHDEWRGTRLTWDLAREGEGTVLRFRHGGWRSDQGWFALCNTTWGELLHRLKAHAEGRAPGPLFTGTA
jgi:uncharacterized protein YndB with AHSA1/START domain